MQLVPVMYLLADSLHTTGWPVIQIRALFQNSEALCPWLDLMLHQKKPQFMFVITASSTGTLILSTLLGILDLFILSIRQPIRVLKHCSTQACYELYLLVNTQ